MDLTEDKEIQILAAADPELARLLEEHRKLDRQVGALDKMHVRTPAEDLERKRLSKLKLANRDRIVQLVAKHRSAAPR